MTKEKEIVVGSAQALGGEAVNVVAALAGGGVQRVELQAIAKDGSRVALGNERAAHEGRPMLSDAVKRVLNRTPVARWSQYALLVDGEVEDARLMSRYEMAQWLRDNALGPLANEALARKVPRGCMLALHVNDSAGTFFRVLGGKQ